MLSHLRRSFVLVLLLALGSGCYSATFYDYPDGGMKADVRDSSREMPMDAKASPRSSPDSRAK